MRSQLALAVLGALALASCGGGERQDKDEPKGDFKVEVVEARFPDTQALAQRSELRITVRNAEARRTVPNIAVTIRGFDTRLEGSTVADPSRPVFVINGRPQEIGTYADSKEDAPRGETAYTGTWALGPLKPGRQRTFKWNVTAVRAGPYQVSYEVAAGLHGKARAVGAGGRLPKGLFSGTVDNEPPDTRVGEDGHSIVKGTR
jgi:hypothetical protein